LPHFDGGEIAQAITFRLAGSLPVKLLERWVQELAHLEAKQFDAERRRRIEDYLEQCSNPLGIVNIFAGRMPAIPE
jgi:hypothetical protein